LVDGSTNLQFEERVAALKYKDFKQFFSDSGLKIEYLFGNFMLDPFDEASSDRLILIAQKS